MEPLLQIQNLSVSFDTYVGQVRAVDHISFQIFPGQAVGIVGESGCGKSVTAHSIMRLIPTPPGSYRSGKILLNDADLLQKTESQMRQIRGKEIGMIFQDPMTSLNPVLTVGNQITEQLTEHQHLSPTEAHTRTIELLRLVGISAPEQRFHEYPHQFSGGMRQRVMIAMAMSCSPKLLIADEPTTALDVTIQAKILDLMKDLQQHSNTAVILISHDLGVVAGLCSRIIVMYAGRIIETGPARDIFHHPGHPYTQGLLRSIPRMDRAQRQPLLTIAGQPPDLLRPPAGCPFHPRCPHAMRICAQEDPIAVETAPDHLAYCWLLHPDAPKTKEAAV